VSREDEQARREAEARERTLRNREAIQQVGCDPDRGGCGALPGERCKSPGGSPPAVPHAVRRRIAVDAGLWVPR
jgi:hypothetical protein